MAWMTLFHFSFDLSHYGLLSGQNFYTDVFWTGQRTAIVSLFLLCAGMGQGLAHEQQLGWARFVGRWWRIVACAALVSAGSWWMFPRSWISFGVLHGMAVMLLLTRGLLLVRPRAVLLLGLAAVCLALPWIWRDAWFDSRWTNWIGLVTRKPITEDYVPLLPWFGVMLIGVVLGRWLAGRRLRQPRAAPAAGLPAALRGLVLLGRWPLSYYMLHQPVMIGLVTAWIALRAV
ncbi:MAG: DUF1624 domain-containing protein [Burkholderiales bacterium]|nr:DUF1624 domain-containing protein [Burkholderiales bacterium]